MAVGGPSKSVRLDVIARGVAAAKAGLTEVTDEADKLDGKQVNVDANVKTAQAKERLDTLKGELDEFGRTVAEAKADVKDDEARRKLLSLGIELRNLNNYTSKPNIDISGIDRAEIRILKVKEDLRKLGLETVHPKVDVDVDKKGFGGLSGLFSGLGGDLSKALSGAFSDAEPIAADGGKTLMSSIGGGMSAGVSSMAVALSLALAITPGITAAALGLGVGVGGIVIAAMTNPKFKKELTSWWGGIEKDLGKDVTPIISAMGPILSGISSFVGKEAGPLKAMFTAAIPSIKLFVNVMETFGKELIPAITTALNTLKPDLPELGKAFKILLSAVVDFIKVIGPGIKPSIIVLVALMQGLKVILIAVAVACDIFAVAWRVAFVECKVIIEIFIDVVKSVWVILRDLFEGKFGKIAGDLGKVWGGLWRELLGQLKAFWDNIKGPLEAIGRFCVKIFDDIKSGVSKAWDATWNSVKRVASAAFHAVEDGAKDFWHGVTRTFDNIKNGIEGAWSATWNAVKRVVSAAFRAVEAGAKDFWHGVVRTFDNIKNGVVSAWDATWSVVKRVASAAMRGIEDVIRGFWHALVSLFESIRRGAVNTWDAMWSDAKRLFSNMVSSVVHIVTGLGSDLFNAGKIIVKLLASGIASAANAVYNTISHIVNRIKGFFHFSPAKEGPLAGAGGMDTAGKNLMLELSRGVTTAENTVKQAITSVVNLIVSDFSKVKNDIGNVWNAMWQNIVNLTSQANSKVKNVLNDLQKTFNSIFSQISHNSGDNIWSSMWHSIETIFSNSYDWISNHLQNLQHAFSSYFTNIKQSVTNAFSGMWDDLSNEMSGGVKKMGNIAVGVEQAFHKPFAWVVSNVIAPFGRIWNTLDTSLKLGITKFPVANFAEGGIVPNGPDGRTTGDVVPAMLTPNERVLSTSQVAMLGGHGALDAAVGRGTGGGGFFAGGGTIGQVGEASIDPLEEAIKKAFKGAGTTIPANAIGPLAAAYASLAGEPRTAKGITSFLTGDGSGTSKILNAALASHLGTVGPGGMSDKMGAMLADAIVKKAYGTSGSPGGSGGGASGAAIAKYGEQFVGHQYILGGPGDNQANHNPPFGAWDCAGFVAQMYGHFGLSGWKSTNVSGLYNWAGTHMDKPTIGGMAFFAGADGTRAAPGHVGLVTGPNQMVNAEDEAMGTRMASLGGASWFGIPPHGFSGGGGGGIFQIFGGGGGFSGTGGEAVYSYLLNNMFHGNKIAAAGATASIWGESGWQPESIEGDESHKGAVPGAGTPGHPNGGLIGWTGTWTGPGQMITGNATTDMANQLKGISTYVRVNGDEGTIAQMQKSKSVFDAANLWGRGVEKFGINDVHSEGVTLAQRIAGLANGGIVSEPSLMMGLMSGRFTAVAEHGPEMVHPLSKPMASYSGGGNSGNIYITVEGDSDPDGAARKIHQKLRDYKRHKGGQKLGLD